MDQEQIIDYLFDKWGCEIGPSDEYNGLMVFLNHWNRDVANYILQLKNVIELDFGPYRVDNDVADDLECLDIINFRAAIDQETHFNFAKKWKHLEELGLAADVGVLPPFPSQDFKECSLLRKIDLYGIGLSTQDYNYFASCSNLSEINLCHTHISPEIAFLKQCKLLKNLSFFKSTLSCPPSALEFIRDSEIKSLEFKLTNIDDGYLAVFENNSSIKSLSIDRTQVTTTGLECLISFSGLTELHIDAGSLTLDGVHHLSKCSQLRSLWVFGSNKYLDNRCVKQLKDNLPQCEIKILTSDD